MIAENSLLKRKVPKKVSSILQKYLNIGRDIEEFVESKQCGADSWRRTSVITFDGNKKKGQKASFRTIQAHLQEKYNTKIGYGTVVQLCVVRNKRKLSSKRYKNVAKVTCRRARKGFILKFNPDAHFSWKMYKILDKLQLQHASKKLVLNRDDQAGFRLDTTYTHSQHRVLSVEQEITTRTDFVNKYSSVLQTSTYLLMETDTSNERAGIVKDHVSFGKNPSHHTSDLKFLKTTEEFKDYLSGKTVDCIRVDGASDKRPSILEVQFLWTEIHLKEEKVCTCVTARNSGGSFLNRVELVNGCTARADSNIFIPSTLNGSNMAASGLSEEKLKANLDTAASVYIDRVQNAPFGKTNIVFFKGNKDEYGRYLENRRQNLLTFLHGSKKSKRQLKVSNPVEYNYFENVWQVRNDHYIKDYPEQYVFLLYLCYKPTCIHPVCRKGKPVVEPKWFDDCPILSIIPMPVKDPKRPWGGQCNECKGTFCSGHYLKAEECIGLAMDQSMDNRKIQPPSAFLKAEFSKLKDHSKIPDSVMERCAQETLLSLDEVKMWFGHLRGIAERRKAGAVKAAATRATKKYTGDTGKILLLQETACHPSPISPLFHFGIYSKNVK